MSDDNIRWQYQMIISDDNIRWYYQMTISDDCVNCMDDSIRRENVKLLHQRRPRSSSHAHTLAGSEKSCFLKSLLRFLKPVDVVETARGADTSSTGRVKVFRSSGNPHLECGGYFSGFRISEKKLTACPATMWRSNTLRSDSGSSKHTLTCHFVWFPSIS